MPLIRITEHYWTLHQAISHTANYYLSFGIYVNEWTKSKTKHNNSITRIQQQEGPCSWWCGCDHNDDDDGIFLIIRTVQCSPFRVPTFQWRLIIANSVRMRFFIVLTPFPITQTNGTQFIAVLIIECFHHDNWHRAIIIALKIGNKNRSIQFLHRTWSLNTCYVHL